MKKKIGAVVIGLVVVAIVIVAAILLLPGDSVPQVSDEPEADALPVETVTSVSQSVPADSGEFITVRDGRFIVAGSPYDFVGANFWQGMNLGVDGPSGDRERLIQELDRLQQLGVTNLRIMASSEGPDTEPYRMAPSLMVSPGEYNESVLDGLDFLLAEMSNRGLKAVMVLNNYWQWSGGMAQYVSWSEGSAIPYPGNWGTFMSYSAKFYDCSECQTWYRDHIAALVNHVNPYTGLAYRDDPAIFSWELANEPRRYPDEWIDETAAYIKSLDPHHLVTTGSEGSPPGERQDFIETHNGSDIDYVTIHIWPQNWGWYDPQNPATYATSEKRARNYFDQHIVYADTLGKPLVLEEFGLARDWEPLHQIYDPDSPTTYRDLFYTAMYEEVHTSMSMGGPAAGDNFWAWSGASRPGDAWVGDPPHEIPGWYSVYDTDVSTLAMISDHVKEISGTQK
jgi:mannan endo-1,4-beta-mannosidase